jgi:putative tryptophan/tyrosine transport system substrate-binding protein
MKRREFIALLAGAAAAWPVAAHTQTPIDRTGKLYRVAVLAPVPEVALRGFFDELRQQGLIEGQNLTIDRSGFNTDYEQLRSRAAELIKARPDAIFCAGDEAIRAAQMATTTIPIVGGTDDMVGSGLARSLSRPGGNTTGVSLLAADLDAKRQEVLAEFFPATKQMAALFDPKTTAPHQLAEIEYSARLLGVRLTTHRVERKEDIPAAVELAKAAGAAALNVLASPLLHGNRQVIIERTIVFRLPAIYQWPDTAREGGLLGYGPPFSEFMRQWVRQLSKVLRGASAGELPIEQPTTFALVLNLKIAKSIGAEISPSLLARADEVIE